MIKTKRLTIRIASDSEMKSMIFAESDSEMKKAYGEMLEGCKTHPDERKWYAVWLMESASGERIGDLCFKGISESGAVEIGYGVLPQYEDRGFATEAVTAMVRWAAAETCVTRVEAETEPCNTASQRVLQKSGFIPTGTIGEEGPRFVWSPASLKKDGENQ